MKAYSLGFIGTYGEEFLYAWKWKGNISKNFYKSNSLNLNHFAIIQISFEALESCNLSCQFKIIYIITDM